MLAGTCIVLLALLLPSLLPPGAGAAAAAALNLTLPGQHPSPELVAQEVHRKVNASVTRRQLLQISEKDESSSCYTGNPIDDCWKCDPNWPNNRQRLADCVIGFGQYALGGKNGEFYIVTDDSDDDPVNPKPGTLRYAVIQTQPLWIVFPANMLIKLSQELIFNSYKTLDGRGANVHIVGGGLMLDEMHRSETRLWPWLLQVTRWSDLVRRITATGRNRTATEYRSSGRRTYGLTIVRSRIARMG